MDLCKKQGKVTKNKKEFFIYNQVLFCKEQIQGIEIYKLVVPAILAHELILQAHRHLACARPQKLSN